MSDAKSNPQTVCVTLRNKRGLHARAASKFVQVVAQYDAHVQVTSQNDTCAETVVGDSIMELLMLGSACGENIIISANGPDAQPVLSALSEMIENRFGEHE